MIKIKYLGCILVLMALFGMSLNTVSGQICPTADVATDDNSFLDECPFCIPASKEQVWDDGATSVPCNLESVSGSEVTGVNFKYVLIFDDEFTGDAVDLDKWITAKQSGTHNVYAGTQDYDNGQNFQFNYPGVSLIDKNVPSFPGYCEDWLTTCSTCTTICSSPRRR